MQFGQILVKIFSQTCELENATSFEPIILNPKNSNLKNFWSQEPEKLKPKPEKIQTWWSSTISNYNDIGWI